MDFNNAEYSSFDPSLSHYKSDELNIFRAKWMQYVLTLFCKISLKNFTNKL